jgi:AraC-like DNA-binding protein
MATLCSISERQLQRIFKRHLQCTPSRWLRELQCRQAKDLIQQGYSTKAAAAELKFASESHFCREFKKVFGNPPQTFAPNPVSSLKALDLERTLERVAEQAASFPPASRPPARKTRSTNRGLASRVTSQG